MNDRPVIYWCLGEAGPEGAGLTISEIQKYLSEEEMAKVDTLRFQKRRDEWTLGRITVKHLLHACIPKLATVAYQRLTIANRPSGAPYVMLDGSPMSLQVSISHRQSMAVAAVTTNAGIGLGIDLEWVEERDPSFYNDYFTPAELELLQAVPAGETARIGTLIWSAKEAMLKALGQGLRLDTRSVEVLRIANNFHEGWGKLKVCAPVVSGATWQGYWQQIGNTICTIAVSGSPVIAEIRQIESGESAGN